MLNPLFFSALFRAFVDLELIHISTVMGVGVINNGSVAGGGDVVKAEHGAAGLDFQKSHVLRGGSLCGYDGSGIIYAGLRAGHEKLI